MPGFHHGTFPLQEICRELLIIIYNTRSGNPIAHSIYLHSVFPHPTANFLYHSSVKSQSYRLQHTLAAWIHPQGLQGTWRWHLQPACSKTSLSSQSRSILCRILTHLASQSSTTMLALCWAKALVQLGTAQQLQPEEFPIGKGEEANPGREVLC